MTSLWIAALGLDILAGEPPALVHPTVRVGALIGALERRTPSSPRAELAYGVLLTLVPVALAFAAGHLVRRLRPWPLRVPLELWLLKSSFSLRPLLDAGRAVERALAVGDLPAARACARSLVSRPTQELTGAQLSSAAIESLAENLGDSYVAPLLWWRIGGLPAALAYRAANTADAMVGYRGRYERLGKASARLDDALSWLPARLSGLAIVAASGQGHWRTALAALRRDSTRTESPNAGWPMAAMAGGLGVRLEKPGHYVLGGGGDPRISDVARARRVVALAALLATAALLGPRRR